MFPCITFEDSIVNQKGRVICITVVMDLGTFKRRGASRDFSEKGVARTLFALFVNFTHDNDKDSNKKVGCQPIAPTPSGSVTVKNLHFKQSDL